MRASGADRIDTSASSRSRALEAESCCETAISANTMAAATPSTAKPADGVSRPARRSLRRGAGALATGGGGRARSARAAARMRIAQLGRRLAVGDGQRQGGRRLQRILVGAAAVVAGGDVLLGERGLIGLERAQSVRADQRGDVVGDLGVGAHAWKPSPSNSRRRESATCVRDFTVPSGSPRCSAISLWLSPLKYASSSTWRCGGGRSASARRTLAPCSLATSEAGTSSVAARDGDVVDVAARAAGAPARGGSGRPHGGGRT